MKFHELIKNKIFALPKTQPKSLTFDKYVEKLLRDFLELVNQLDGDYLEFDNGLGIDPEFIKMTQETIVDGLINTIKEYYNGLPFIAYQKLNGTLRNNIKDLYAIIKQKEYLPNEDFYRIRNKEDNFPYTASEMFHIPFEMRGKVTTQRFSIPGFPSLYLGRTLYVCWEELNRPQIDSFQAVRLKNTENIRFLDLTTPVITDHNINSGEVYRYFMTWPLIACCSIKVKDYTDIFKPEYIIPQLLLQWVRDNDRLDGIRYKSTHIEPALYMQDGELTNLVLPVKGNKEKGHCDKLIDTFESTEVVSWQIHEFSVGGENFMFNSNELDYIDNKLPKLELIKGRKYPYSYSVLGRLEYYLDKMDTKKIK